MSSELSCRAAGGGLVRGARRTGSGVDEGAVSGVTLAVVETDAASGSGAGAAFAGVIPVPLGIVVRSTAGDAGALAWDAISA